MAFGELKPVRREEKGSINTLMLDYCFLLLLISVRTCDQITTFTATTRSKTSAPHSQSDATKGKSRRGTVPPRRQTQSGPRIDHDRRERRARDTKPSVRSVQSRNEPPSAATFISSPPDDIYVRRVSPAMNAASQKRNGFHFVEAGEQRKKKKVMLFHDQPAQSVTF